MEEEELRWLHVGSAERMKLVGTVRFDLEIRFKNGEDSKLSNGIKI